MKKSNDCRFLNKMHTMKLKWNDDVRWFAAIYERIAKHLLYATKKDQQSDTDLLIND